MLSIFLAAAAGALGVVIAQSAPPWGRWVVLEDKPDYKVKRIEVDPGHRLSYQKHERRSEHWVVIKGTGTVTLDGVEIELHAGRAIDIPCGAAHRMANNGPDVLVFIEVQTGDYFGEDDIVRLEDDYNREGTVG